MNMHTRLNNRFLAGMLIDSQGRAKNGEALTEGQLRVVAPSIFAETKHESRSDRFAYIPTWNVVQAMMREGFQPVAARQGFSRTEGKADFTKHVIRFRHPDARPGTDVVPEVLLMNAHDGTSSYRVMGGAFRGICKNGLIAAEQMVGDVKIGHKGNVADQVIEGTYEVVENVGKLIGNLDTWRGLDLSRDEQVAFAESAHVLRFEDASQTMQEAIAPPKLLIAHRPEDNGSDLWRTFNRVQENVIRGGLTGYGRAASGRMRRTTTRPINNIDQDTKLNRALMVLASKMAELKAA